MRNGANCMHRTKLTLRAALSPDHLAEPDDILDTKKTLMALGYYRPVDGAEPGAWVDTDLFTGIRQFQRDNGLQADALIRPGGPTEQAMNAVLEDAPRTPPANDDQPPANDDQVPWDEAAKGKYGPPWKGPPKKGPIQEEKDDHYPGVPGGRTNAQCWEDYMLELSECDQRYHNNFPKRSLCQQAAFGRYVACKENWPDKPSLPGRRK
jgi:hypothetical protein